MTLEQQYDANWTSLLFVRAVRVLVQQHSCTAVRVQQHRTHTIQQYELVRMHSYIPVHQ